LSAVARNPPASAAASTRSQAPSVPLTTQIHGGFIRPHNRHHAARRRGGRFLHIPAAGGDQFQTIFKTKRAGKVQCGVFAKAQSRVGGYNSRVDDSRLHRSPKTGNARREQCRLADVGLIKQRFGPVKTDGRNQKAENVVGLLKRLAGGDGSRE
jgi:hypothetical protein